MLYCQRNMCLVWNLICLLAITSAFTLPWCFHKNQIAHLRMLTKKVILMLIRHLQHLVLMPCLPLIRFSYNCLNNLIFALPLVKYWYVFIFQVCLWLPNPFMNIEASGRILLGGVPFLPYSIFISHCNFLDIHKVFQACTLLSSASTC